MENHINGFKMGWMPIEDVRSRRPTIKGFAMANHKAQQENGGEAYLFEEFRIRGSAEKCVMSLDGVFMIRRCKG